MSTRPFKNLFQVGAYSAVSAAALGVDLMVGFLLTLAGFSIPSAATIGYAAGLVSAFPFMRRLIFSSRFSSYVAEFTLYAISGALGLALTSLISYLSNAYLGFGYFTSKALAVTGSFLAVFLLRYFLVFRRFREGPPAFESGRAFRLLLREECAEPDFLIFGEGSPPRRSD